MTKADFLERPPESASITDYDRAHMTLYLRLLDAASDGAAWEEAVSILFGIDPAAEPEIDVVDVRYRRPKGVGELQVRLHPLLELFLAEVQHGAVAGQRDAGVVGVGHVDLRDPFGDGRIALERRRHARGRQQTP